MSIYVIRFVIIKQFLFIPLFFLAYGIQAQYDLSGKVINAQKEDIGFSHVYNRTMGLGKVSDINGKFKLTATKGDTVLFSYVGYSKLELIVDNEHLNKFLLVELVGDSILLPSITIYSDPYFKVPFRYQGVPMHMEGINIPGKTKHYRAGSITTGGTNQQLGDPLAPGITLNGPITYFSKDEKEKRAAVEAERETEETINYQVYIARKNVRDRLCEKYDLDSAEYTEVITRINRQFPQIQKARKPTQIWYTLIAHFDRIVPVIKQYQFIIED
ncbi:MAG: hypothetical protein ACI9A7_001271 [Cyclobacteriaceae bacterium]|jgi:hypothetical protein